MILSLLFKELLRHEVLGNDFMPVNGTQQMQMAPQDFQCLNLPDELSDHQAVIQDLENLVGEAEMKTENNDISKIIEFHENDVGLDWKSLKNNHRNY